jgi:hypothetical protein
MERPLASSIAYNLLQACGKPGCPVCRLEQHAVERYLDNKFYENVNTPAWRDQLRASLGFCEEHASLAVEKRLGDALGFSIIYRDILNSILNHLKRRDSPPRTPRRWVSLLGQIPEQAQTLIEKMFSAFTPRKRCPACEHRDKTTRSLLSVLVEEMQKPEMVNALEASEGLCLPHLRLALEHVRDVSVCETLLTIHREKLESMKAELEEFIRKNDYQFAAEGFGKEGDAWLRAIGTVTGRKRQS